MDCAFSAGASCIVSNDAHFRILENVDFPKIIVMRIQDFIQIL